MAVPTEDVWKRDAHTGAKHDLLRAYLTQWLPKLVQGFPQGVTYAEGFAGPGVYTGGEPGSPVIAIDVINRHRTLFDSVPRRRLDLVFVEEKQSRTRRLITELDNAMRTNGGLPRGVTLHPPIAEDCRVALPRVLTDIGAWRKPMLVVLDSFGGPDVPFTLLQQIAHNPSSEVLVTFGAKFLERFGSIAQHAVKGREAFGGDHWQGMFEQRPDRKGQFLLEAYRTTLRNAGFAHTLAFEMVDEGGHQLWLVFGTTKAIGVDVMKDAMWSVDRSHGVRYRDPSDPDQLTLDILDQPNTAPLETMLLAEVGNQEVSIEQLREYTRDVTVYRAQHVWEVVGKMLNDGRLERTESGPRSAASIVRLPSPKRQQDSLF